jgi:hypothetical protein
VDLESCDKNAGKTIAGDNGRRRYVRLHRIKAALPEPLLRRFIAEASPNKWDPIAAEPTNQKMTGGKVAYLLNGRERKKRNTGWINRILTRIG